jgi:putative ABC transport system ATP-binding protein
MSNPSRDLTGADALASPLAALHGRGRESAEEGLIELIEVRRRYGRGDAGVEALRGVSLRIRRGEFVAVWGPSGSGKSTLMNVLGLIDFPTAGEMRLAGMRITRLSDDRLSELRNRTIGFIFQNFNLLPVLSALENVMVPLQIQGVKEPQAKARAIQALIEVGLGDQIGSRPDKMSGGQRQRVAIARALVAAPSLVVADEPTANLDSETSDRVIELMRRLNRSRQVTFIFTTHDQRLLQKVDRKLLLKDGQLQRDEEAL